MSEYICKRLLPRELSAEDVACIEGDSAVRYAAGFNECVRILNKLPTADVKAVRHGRWEPIKNLYQCSVCGHPTVFNTTSYCGSCGAKMETEDDE